jgi:hypothetical protein
MSRGLSRFCSISLLDCGTEQLSRQPNLRNIEFTGFRSMVAGHCLNGRGRLERSREISFTAPLHPISYRYDDAVGSPQDYGMTAKRSALSFPRLRG